jgi:hypothetical protein
MLLVEQVSLIARLGTGVAPHQGRLYLDQQLVPI